MHKLTIQEISFINKYLRNSGVQYADIRYEMTDHVATALEELEGDFYDNFKEYMIKHKAQLLKSNKKFGRIALRNAITQLFKNMVSILGIGILCGLFGLLSLMAAFMPDGIELVFDIIPAIMLMAFVITYIVTVFKRLRESWSVTDKMLATTNTMVYLIIAIIKPERLIDSQTILILYYSVITTFLIMAMVSFIKLKRKYKLQYNG